MLKNYITIAWRNLLRHKVYAAINLIGLATGIAACVLIFLYVQDEMSYDRHHSKSDRIYRITRDFVSPNSNDKLHLGHIAPAFGPLLRQDFPEIELMGRMYANNFLVTDQASQKTIREEAAFYAEPEIFGIFDIPVVKGNAEQALSEPNQVLLSNKLAHKLFPGEEPLGKMLRLDNQFNVKVAGVYQDFPANSHMHPQMLVSFATLNDSTIYGERNLRTSFSNNAFGTYLLLPEGSKPADIEAKFPDFLDRHLSETASANGITPSSWTHLFLQKVTDIHLYSHLDSEVEPNGDIASVSVLALVALFILIIACINYINLSTARSAGRAKEVGIRKVVGAYQSWLVWQFLLESVVITLLATLLAFGLMELVLPWLNGFTGKQLSFALITDWRIWGFLLLLPFIVGVLAGLYPAFFLAGFQPVKVLKGRLSSSSGNPLLRKSLVVLQFAISIVLIIATGIMFQQLMFLQNKKLGFEKDRVVVLPYYQVLGPHYKAFREEAGSAANIAGIGKSSLVPSDRLLNSLGSARVQRGDSMVQSEVTLKFVTADHALLDVYKVKFAAGRNFSLAHPTDDTSAFILNEKAVRNMGWADPQEAIYHPIQYGGMRGRIIGVVKDHHFESLHQEVSPMIFLISRSDRYSNISVKVNGDPQQALAHLEKTWNKFLPNYPFEYEFMDDMFGKLYLEEQKKSYVFTVFSCIAISIACLGLFGLASFTTLQRTKEIGIRKVFGASVRQIVALLSTDFMKLVLVANVLAWPVVWWSMNKWLENFAYRTEIGIGIFILAAILAFAIALLTISFQAIKAATSNPVTTLRTE